MYSLDTYKEIFKGKDQDILDEIRSSVLDNVDLTPYITNDPHQDPYRLQQIRVALKLGINEPWLQGFGNGDILRRLRHLHLDGINLDPINHYIGYHLSEEYYVVLLDLIENGVPLPEDFSLNRIPQHLLSVLKTSLIEGFYDDRLFTSGIVNAKEVSALTVLLKKLATSGTEYTVSDEFFTCSLELIKAVYSQVGFYSPGLIQHVLEHPGYYTDPDTMHLLAKIERSGMLEVPFTDLCQLPTYQLELLEQGTAQGLAIPALYEAGALSYSEAKLKYDEALIFNTDL